METVHETLGNGRFDMVALVSMMKDLRSDDCLRLTDAIQCGNTAVLQALASGDKSAMLAAAGIERHLSNTGNDILREIAESGRDTTKEVCDGIRDTTREINGVGRDLLRAIECGEKATLSQLMSLERARCDDKHDLARVLVDSQRQTENAFEHRFGQLHSKVDSGFSCLSKQVSDLQVEAIKTNYEAQLREKDNTAAILAAVRDNRDTTKDENRLTREQLREEWADEMRSKYSRVSNKYDELKSDLRQFERSEQDRRYTREVIHDALQSGHHRGHHDHYCEDDFDFGHHHGHHGRRFHGHGAQQNVRVYVDGRRRFRDRDDDGHGNGGNGNGGNPHDD